LKRDLSGRCVHAVLEDRLMTRGRSGSEAGFSLVEMLVAMTITLIVSGAIYGLLAGGQNAFRREPELTDRQQNIRIAMNLIMRDIANAGTGMPPFIQSFTTGLEAPTGAPTNAAGAVTDELEILTNNSGRDNEPICLITGGNGATVQAVRNVDTTILPANTPVMLFMTETAGTGPTTWGLRNVTGVTSSTTAVTNSACTVAGGGAHATLAFAAAAPPGLNGANACIGNGPYTTSATGCMVNSLGFGAVVRYRIRVVSNVPVLQRWSSDDPTGFVNGAPDPNAYDEVARGIEDLQIEYATAGAPDFPGTPVGAPAVVASNPVDPGDYAKLITKVRVTLVARAEGRKLAGGSDPGSTGQPRVRGTLTSVGTPRAALIHVANAQTGLWR
jgi:prepilin-type N-terminal cleavage/methylation domain-containing protein